MPATNCSDEDHLTEFNVEHKGQFGYRRIREPRTLASRRRLFGPDDDAIAHDVSIYCEPSAAWMDYHQITERVGIRPLAAGSFISVRRFDHRVGGGVQVLLGRPFS